MQSQRCLYEEIVELLLGDGIAEVPMRSKCSAEAVRWNRRGAYTMKLQCGSCALESQRCLYDKIAELSLLDGIAEVPMR